MYIGNFYKLLVKARNILFQWYGGLRGAVCFALCSSLDETFEFKQMYLTATLTIVFFTVFIQVGSLFNKNILTLGILANYAKGRFHK